MVTSRTRAMATIEMVKKIFLFPMMFRFIIFHLRKAMLFEMV